MKEIANKIILTIDATKAVESKPIKKKSVVITRENKCEHCDKSKCCQYVTSPIDTPRSIREFDHLLWQVSHQNTHAFKDKDGWYIVFQQPCQHLASDGRCGIYEKRPFICREHTNDYCEFDSSYDEGCELYFDDYQSLDEYCRKRFKSWDNRFKK